MAEAARRFRRVVRQGNAITIQLAAKDVKQNLANMAPFDLVNTLQICPVQALKDSIVEEAERRKFKKFNGTDLTILLTSSGTALKSLPVLRFPAMKTSDICTCIWALGRRRDAAELIIAGVAELAASRISEMSVTNTTQVLGSLSRIARFHEIDQIFLKNITHQLIVQQISPNAIPFILFALAQCRYEATEFAARVTACIVDKSVSLSNTQLVDTVRALARLRQLKQELVDEYPDIVLAASQRSNR